MLGLIYSLACYVGFLAVFTYFGLFSDGVAVPKTVDSGLPDHLGPALLVDLGLMLAFGLQHSVMARAGFKRALTRLIPVPLERATFVLASSAALALLIWQWRPVPIVLWSVENPVAAACLWVVNALGWLGVPATSFMIDHFDLFGVKPTWNRFRRRSLQRTGFVTPLLYRYVRHPMMTSLLIGFWVTPHMTVGHLLLSLGMSVYILVGVHFEERSLVQELGGAYVRYQTSTPRFLPGTAKRALPDGPAGSQTSRGAA
jgi:protein-S-isoprenylcysteine O-methyltransferase Ste14